MSQNIHGSPELALRQTMQLSVQGGKRPPIAGNSPRSAAANIADRACPSLIHVVHLLASAVPSQCSATGTGDRSRAMAPPAPLETSTPK
jgi:hypothetical protein